MSVPTPRGRPAWTQRLRRTLRAFARIVQPVARFLQAVYYAIRVTDELMD
ncbi:hypothetical protein AB0F45_14910 [Streptomyces achromogenes]